MDPINEEEASLQRSVQRDSKINREIVLKVLEDMKNNPDRGSNSAGQACETCPPLIREEFIDYLIKGDELIMISFTSTASTPEEFKKEIMEDYIGLDISEEDIKERVNKAEYFNYKAITIEIPEDVKIPKDEHERIRTLRALYEDQDKLMSVSGRGLNYWSARSKIKKELDEYDSRYQPSILGFIKYIFTGNSFGQVDKKVQSNNHSSNYSIFGLTDSQVDDYIAKRVANGDDMFWIAMKLTVRNVTYNVWNMASWGALKKIDKSHVEYANKEIDGSEYASQLLFSGGTSLLEASTAGYLTRTKFFLPAGIIKINLKSSLISGASGYSANAAVQYTTTGKIDHSTALMTGGMSLLAPNIGYKSTMAVVGTGVYIDQTRQDIESVDKAINTAESMMGAILGKGVSGFAGNTGVTRKIMENIRIKRLGRGGNARWREWESYKDTLDASILGASIGFFGSGAGEYFPFLVEYANEVLGADKEDEGGDENRE